MKKALLLSLSLIAFFGCYGQNNIKFSAAVAYTIGPPTFKPMSTGSRVAIDTTTYIWYESLDPNTNTWISKGYWIQEVVGCANPASAPGKHQSIYVTNQCATPQLFKWNGSAWVEIAGAGTDYTAGAGIDITGSVISNTGDLSNTNEIQNLSLSGQSLSISGGTGATLPIVDVVAGAGIGVSKVAGVATVTNTNAELWTDGGAWLYPTTTGDNAVIGSATQLNSAYKLQITGGIYSKGAGLTSATRNFSGYDSAGDEIFYVSNNGAMNAGKVTTTFATDASFFPIQVNSGIINFQNNAVNIFSSAGAFSGELSCLGTGLWGNVRGVNFIVKSKNSNASSAYKGAYFSARIGSAAGRAASLIGVQADAWTDDATGGTVGEIAGFKNELLGVTSAGVTATGLFGIKLSDILNTGTITSTYGVYVGDVTTGTQTNKAFSIYSSDANALNYFSGVTGVGTSAPNASAKLEIASTTSGVLFPRMTTTQRDAIASPADGLVLYNSTTNKLQVRAAGAWSDLH
jgi:hypothetical protein